jgi:hypothetical protein
MAPSRQEREKERTNLDDGHDWLIEPSVSLPDPISLTPAHLRQQLVTKILLAKMSRSLSDRLSLPPLGRILPSSKPAITSAASLGSRAGHSVVARSGSLGPRRAVKLGLFGLKDVGDLSRVGVRERGARGFDEDGEALTAGAFGLGLDGVLETSRRGN